MSEGDRHAHKVNDPKAHCCDGRGGVEILLECELSRMTHRESVWGRGVGGSGICRDDPDHLVFVDLYVGDRILFLIFDVFDLIAGKDSRK